MLLTSLVGCSAEVDMEAATDSSAPGAAGASFAATVLPLVNQACNCHQSSPILMAPFSLKPGEAYDNLVRKPSQQVVGMVLVEPGSLNGSYLWFKVNGTQAEVNGMGQIMPPTVPLIGEERSIIERWIAAGAPR